MIVGIDLGTTNSLVGVWTADGAKLLEEGGDVLLPSVVALDPDGGVVVGRTARNRRLVAPERTVVSVKRLMGRSTEVELGERRLSPPQISALILGALLDRVEAELGERPDRAIITVPAYFDDIQRQATRDAGELAGLRVERLVNEPTAAALGYDSGEEQLVLVYDLGGGTFDVSILEREAELLEVLTSFGDTRLGGDDIDEALCDLVLTRMGADGDVVRRDRLAKTRLLELVERAKIALSSREETKLHDPFVTEGGVHIDLEITRDDLEAVAAPWIERTLAHVDQALRDAKIRPADLDRVLLVGGSSKMPLVARRLEEHLELPTQRDLDADTAVAVGAVMLAGRADGRAVEQVLVDLTPHTLSAGTADDEWPMGEDQLLASAVIPRNTVVPAERKRTFYTAHDEQEGVEFPICQGEGERVGDNTYLGVLNLGGLPPSPAGSPVEVTFRLDLSGVLNVTVLHVSSGRQGEARISQTPYRLTARQRREAQQEVAELRLVKRGQDEAAPAGASSPSPGEVERAKAMLKSSERAIERAKAGGTEASAISAAERARSALSVAVEASSADLSQPIEALTDALLDLL